MNEEYSKHAKKPINVAIGQRIRSRRTDLKYTREQLAEMVDVSPRFINSLENGSCGLSNTSLVKMAEALKVTCDYLLRDDRVGQMSLDFGLLLREVRPEDRAELCALVEHLFRTYKSIAKKGD